MSVWGTVYTLKLFPGNSWLHQESNYLIQLLSFVTFSRLTNIYVIPIDYAFQPRLRDRLTLRRLTLHRNPWTFGGDVSHISLRYSCQHSHLWYLQQTLQFTFTDLHNAPLPHIARSATYPYLRCIILAPLHFQRKVANRLVSYYAFFKGWLLLSQPPSCFGVFTSFHT